MTPPFTVTIEPVVSGVVQCLRSAPGQAGGAERWLINVTVTISNTSASTIHASKILLRAANREQPTEMNLPIPGHEARAWCNPVDFVLPEQPGRLTVEVHAFGHSAPVSTTFTIQEHRAATSDGAYRFWGHLCDLRPGEYWQVHSLAHHNTPQQAFGFDVGVAAAGGNGLLPDTSGTENAHHRIWMKPIHAVADGVVAAFLNTFPGNPRPLTSQEINDKKALTDIWPELKAAFDGVNHGNGNFFTVRSGDVCVTYAHMQPGTLNPALLQAGRAVKRGDFLGLAGNSGQSSGPHLHIHASRPGGNAWDGPAMPMPFVEAHAVAWSAMGASPVAAPWVKLAGRGVPTAVEGCAIWPSDHPVFKRRQIEVKHLAISASGQAWVVRTDGRVLSTRDPLYRRRSSAAAAAPPEQAVPAPGLWFNVDPNGSAREVCVVDEQPFLIGDDGRLWRGLSSGFVGVAGSTQLLRIAADHAGNKVWCIEADHRVVSFSTATGRWERHPGDGWAADIAVVGGVPHVIGRNKQIYRSVGAGGWAHFSSGEGKRIAADPETGALAVIGNDDGIYRYQGGNWNEHPGEGKARELAWFGDLLIVVGIGDDHGLWRSLGANGWRRLNAIEAG